LQSYSDIKPNDRSGVKSVRIEKIIIWKIRGQSHDNYMLII